MVSGTGETVAVGRGDLRHRSQSACAAIASSDQAPAEPKTALQPAAQHQLCAGNETT